MITVNCGTDEESGVEMMEIHIFVRVFLADFTSENLGAEYIHICS